MVATVIGTLWGAVAGYFGGFIDAVMMRVVDAALSIPILFLLIVLATIITPTKLSHDPDHLDGVLAGDLPAGPRRGAVPARARVRAGGPGDGRRIVRGSCSGTSRPTPSARSSSTPRSRSPTRSCFIAYISYLGLGLPPPTTDLGGMLSNGSVTSDDGYWWLIYPAGALIVIIVIAVNFIGDALRDAFEVRLQRR